MECVRCGSPSSHSVICLECFLKTNRLLTAPEYLDLYHCPKCDSWSANGKSWLEDSREAAWAGLRHDLGSPDEVENITLDIDVEVEERVGTVTVSLGGSYDDKPVSDSAEIKLRAPMHVCQECSRRSGYYFEAIVQIRGNRYTTKEELESTLERFMTKAGKDATRVEDTKGGFDVYVVSKDTAKQAGRGLADELGTRTVETSSHGGSKDGKELTRLTVLIRLSPFKAGVIVERHGRPHVVRTLGRTPYLVDLTNGQGGSVNMKDIEPTSILARPEDVRETVVVAVDSAGTMILDPETNRTITVLSPFEAGAGETVRVVHVEERWYLLPPERTG